MICKTCEENNCELSITKKTSSLQKEFGDLPSISDFKSPNLKLVVESQRPPRKEEILVTWPALAKLFLSTIFVLLLIISSLISLKNFKRETPANSRISSDKEFLLK